MRDLLHNLDSVYNVVFHQGIYKIWKKYALIFKQKHGKNYWLSTPLTSKEPASRGVPVTGDHSEAPLL